MAHMGVGVFVIGVSLVATISTEKHLAMGAGDTFEAAGYQFEFQGIEPVQGPNWIADQGRFVVTRDGQLVTELLPQKRRYSRTGQMMTEAAIDPGLTRDLYVSMGEPLDNQGDRWGIRIYFKPFVRFIWLGALMMALGGFIAAFDRRYRHARDTVTTQTEPLVTA